MTYSANTFEPGEGLRHFFRGTASGVYIITTCAQDGTPMGLTASSVASVSLAPPIVSFSLQAGASSAQAIVETKTVAIHSVGVRSWHIAQRFSTSGIDRFADLEWSRSQRSGVPIISGLNGYVEASVTQTVAVGLSTLFLVELTDAHLSAVPQVPLVHAQRGYWRPEKIGDC